MDIQQLQNDKLNIINWISQLQDYSIVEKVKGIMNSPDAYLLSNEQKKAIDVALQSIETNGTTPHNTVMEETKKRFPHLYNR
jgi:site-specific DNA-cytosine methylase